MYTQLTSTYAAPAIQLDKRQVLSSPITWYTVAEIVLLSFAADIALAVLIWCVAHGQHEVISWHIGANNMVRIGCQ